MRTKLNNNELYKFCELAATNARNFRYQIELGLSSSEVDLLKDAYGVSDLSSAKLKFQKMEDEKYAELDLIRKKNKADYDAMNKKLRSYNNVKAVDKKDVSRPLRTNKDMQASLEKLSPPSEDTGWRLESESSENINTFQRDVSYRGIGFCISKYNCSLEDIKSAANYYKLNINWDLVKR